MVVECETTKEKERFMSCSLFGLNNNDKSYTIYEVQRQRKKATTKMIERTQMYKTVEKFTDTLN